MDKFNTRSLPTVNPRTKKLWSRKQAGGGHGQLGMLFLQEALTYQAQEGSQQVEIRAFFNGDGTNNSADPIVVGYMAKNNIPIIMITTTKTGIDKKGGQIGLEKITLEDGSEVWVPSILELAQVPKDQIELFRQMGLTEGQAHAQYFNTNVALLNYTVLSKLLKGLAKIIGEDEVKKIITPTLIPNPKDGEDKYGKFQFIQLDSALASALLNLNAYFVLHK